MDIQKVNAFIRRWEDSQLREQQAAQSHFNELCDLVDHPHPTEQDPAGTAFTFEKQVLRDSGKSGRADVWYKGKFAWEYKGKLKNLDEAYSQLQSYRAALENPPLLVVCDFLEYRVYPQWPDIDGRPFIFRNEDLNQPQVYKQLWSLFHDPLFFKRERDEELQRRSELTEQLAYKFAILADKMRDLQITDTTYQTPDGIIPPLWSPFQVARFLTRLVFVFFAQKIGLLPAFNGEPLVIWMIKNARRDPLLFAPQLKDLFKAMNGEKPDFLYQILGRQDRIPWFNGGLFADAEVLDILHPDLLIDQTLELLDEVANADWNRVNPTIVGTLFERALDKNKRSQLGAHYTSEADIRLLIEPILMQPLRREWAEAQAAMGDDLRIILDESSPPRITYEAGKRLRLLYERMITRLKNLRVLDPACGSGNFLYVALRALKDLEAAIIAAFRPVGFEYRDVVTPQQFYGIELNIFAAQLARVVIWIGYLQWRSEQVPRLRPIKLNEAFVSPDQLMQPIIRDMLEDGEHIQNDDAVLRYDAEGNPYEPEWPAADVVIGNPPFLGGKRLRTEIEDRYVDDLFSIYQSRVPREADLVCYWFEKARAQIEQKKTKRAGLLATNSIRGGANRTVLDRVKQTGDIFIAWGDRPWLLESAAVRISAVGFDDGTEKEYILDGAPVDHINSDLQNTIDATKARNLPENHDICFMADTKGGAFDISAEVATQMLGATNKSGKPNSDVVRPWVNGIDITRNARNMWIIDFGIDMPIEEARQYEKPFQYIEQYVYPERQQNRRESYKNYWWIHVEPRPSMRLALSSLRRYPVTLGIAKHRLFIWLSGNVLPDHALFAFARDDDYFFGVLHSYLHERWALRLGTSLEDRPRYTPTTTFETYPFPFAPGKEPTDNPQVQAVAAAAKTLHEIRDAWLNPPEGTVSPTQLRQRTLTNLYNAVESYRETKAASKAYITQESNPASKVAEQIAGLHDALDAAVLAAYGWSDLADRLRTEAGDEELLRRLLALNLERAAAQGN